MFRRTDFKKLELLGGGKKNTKVFKVKHIKTQKQYVLKEVEARNLDKLNEYKEEAVQLSRVQNHPNILQFYGYYFYETPHNTFKLGIISELITNDSNLELIYRKREKSRIFWTEPQLLQMIYSMIDAFSYLEYIGICHRDIKPTNLFLMDNYQIKVIDFGESKESFDEEDEDHTTMATIRGTPQYLSPILWEAHVITQAKQVEHNMFKSDVFSAGLVLFQMAAMMDVSGFNQKTSNVDGEKLIREGLRMISKRYSNNIIEILGKMLQFNEDKRPNFIELGKFIAGNDFVPRTDKSIMQYIRERVNREQNQNQIQIVNNNKSNNQNNNNNINNNKENDEQKEFYFSQYIKKHNLKFNMRKIAYWFEYGGNMIAKHQIIKNDNNSKWKLIAKYKGNFPYHCITLYTNEQFGIYIIGGTDNNNTYQFLNGQIYRKNSMNIERSFMSCLFIPHLNSILSIGGYDYTDKNQLSSIESYDIINDTWSMSAYQDLKVPRSQANVLLYNNSNIFIFGGYNKNFGTLNSIERLDLENKKCDLLELKLPIPLRRFASMKITDHKILIMGGITRLCKESDSTFIVDIENDKIMKYSSLPKGGIVEQEIFLDEIGGVHLFFENNYGTAPPEHVIFNYLDFNQK